jgi:hypothetical protein
MNKVCEIITLNCSTGHTISIFKNRPYKSYDFLIISFYHLKRVHLICNFSLSNLYARRSSALCPISAKLISNEKKLNSRGDFNKF